MSYFTIDELCKSDTAAKNKIDNKPNDAARKNLQTLIDKVLDPIRAAWGKPIYVNSGYRCPDLNKLVNGSTTSQHTLGEAADLNAGGKTNNEKLFKLILRMREEKKISFDQLIDENDYSWVHISYREGRNHNQVLKLTQK